MKTNKIKSQFIDEYNCIMPDFESILAKINSVEVSLQPAIAKAKKSKPKFVNVWNKSAEVEVRQPKTKLITAIMSLCICVMLVAVPMFYCGVFSVKNDIVIELDKKADSYVSLNINPEFDFAVNKFNKITTVKSKNESSKLLLSQLYKTLNVETLVGMEINGTLLSVIDEAAKMGYIDVDSKGLSNAIMIDVMGANVTACANTKNLLANEANTYFADKGILALVVTNYDSKAALVAEAKKANPSVSADASIGELISTVETADGGKSMYELEIERIKKENGDYSSYLDKDEIARVNFATLEKIYLYNDLIAKQNKIISNLEILKTDYAKQIDEKNVKISALQKDIEYYTSEIAKINADPSNYGSAIILKQSLEDVRNKIGSLSNELKQLEDALINIDTEYENKLIALKSSKIQLEKSVSLKEEELALSNKNIADNKKIIADYDSKNIAITKSIDEANKIVEGKYSALEVFRAQMSDALDKIEKSNCYYQLETIVAAVDGLNDVLLPKLELEYRAKFDKLVDGEKHNCVSSVPEFTAIKIVEKMAENSGVFIKNLKDNYSGNINDSITAVINKYYYEIIYDKTIFSDEEIAHNKKQNEVGREVIEKIIKAHLAKSHSDNVSSVIDEGINGIIVNLDKADQLINALNVTESGISVDSEKLKIEMIDVKAERAEYQQLYNEAEISYNQINSEITAINITIEQYSQELASNQLIIDGHNDEIISIKNGMDIINIDIDKLKTNIAAIAVSIAEIDNAKENERAKLENDIKNIQIEIADCLIEEKQFIKDINISIENNKKLAIEYSAATDKIQTNLQTIISEITAINVKINTTNNDIDAIKDIVIGYNQIIILLKNFSTQYSHGARIIATDKLFENQFNLDIMAIESLILALRTASEKEMQASVKNNLDKMAEAKLNKNITKYNSHTDKLTEEELNNWQHEQEEFVNEQGWENIYKAWQASQNL